MFPSVLLLFLAVTTVSISSLTSAGTPRVLPIVEIINSTFHLNSTNLKDITNKVPPNVEVGVIAIAGEYRQGKSFLLNFFLQYLQYRSKNETVPKVIEEADLPKVINEKSHPWLRDVKKNSGFQFKSGTTRDTTGINIWSEPYLIKSKSGKQLALLLMDSQGLYDKDTSTDDNVRLFTMVSMMSSLLMLNVKSNINSNQLKELQYFLNYASNGTMTGTRKPFQTLTFLIRDFTLAEEFGWTGGGEVLKNFMSSGSDGSHPEIQAITQSLEKGFETINAFAMPMPGYEVIKKDYNGSLIKIDMKFLQQLQSFIIDTVESTAPKNDRLENLQGIAFLSYTQDLVTVFNKKLSPQELNRLQESKMLIKILDDISNTVNKYGDHMTNYVRSKPGSFFGGKSHNDITTEIQNEHNRHEAFIMKNFSSLPISKINVRLSSDGKPVTASQDLKEKINKRYLALSPQLVKDAIEKKKEWEIQQIQLEISKLVKKYTDEMKRYAREIPDSFFERYSSDGEIKSEIGRQHKRKKAAILSEFAELPVSKFDTTITVGAKNMTSLELLTERVEHEFEEIVGELFKQVKEKRDLWAGIPHDGDIGEKSCCPLVWKTLENNQYIPRDAVEGGIGKNKRKIYYTGLDGQGWNPSSPDKIGVVNEANPRESYYERKNKAYTYDGRCIQAMKGKKQTEGCPQKPIVILTNPFQCTLDWWKREKKRDMPSDTVKKLHPNIGSKYFARRKFGNYIGAGVVDFKSNGNQGDFHEVLGDSVWNYASAGTEILYIDCDKSFPTLIQAELVKVDFSISTLLDRKSNVSLASTIINNSKSSASQTSKVTLTARQMEQLSISYENSLIGRLKVETSVSAGVPLAELLTLTVGLKVTTEIEAMAKIGRLQLKEKESTFSFEQTITVPPHTVMKVDIISTPIKGSVPFFATYVLKSNAFKSAERMMETMKRQGFQIPLNHTLEEDRIIFTLKGTMDIQSGYNTQVVIRET